MAGAAKLVKGAKRAEPAQEAVRAIADGADRVKRKVAKAGHAVLLAQADPAPSVPEHRYMSRLGESRNILRSTYEGRSAPLESKPIRAEKSAVVSETPEISASTESANVDALPPELRALMPDGAESAPKVLASEAWQPKPEVLETPKAGPVVVTGPAVGIRRPAPAAAASPTPRVESTWGSSEPVRVRPGTPAARYDWSNHGGS